MQVIASEMAVFVDNLKQMLIKAAIHRGFS
jgi:hypothetical protein